MNIYVETNFVLEVALLQEENQYCKDILEICKEAGAKLIIPAFSLGEPYDTLVRRWKQRNQLSDSVSREISQLSRTSTYKDKTELGKQMTGFFVKSIEEEELRLNNTFKEILDVAEIIPLDREVIVSAYDYRKSKSLDPQDSIVYASVIKHLSSSTETTNCFINKNSSDFDDPDIIEELKKYNCEVLFNFGKGYQYIKLNSE